ncbi:MAG: DUF1553 domain-containing protein [Verrucomicrobia bacterium]|nr:DUF1553 domain-containing protein [Verrucomicrobiota bacterium]
MLQRALVLLPTLLVSGSVFSPLVADAGPAKDPFKPADRQHWAFQKVGRPAPPKVKNSPWVRNPIDAFVLSELEAKGLQPAPPADKITLLRRATLDLTGLPPTPEEADAFLRDKSAESFAHIVDHLLDSPQYGERWARHWLDLARYAESDGFKEDAVRPDIWRYRDYVIKSFNNDKPYDRFIKEQIAGDELWPDDPDARTATAFNRHYPDESNARILTQRRQEILNDITDTVGAVFTGLTYACARCHNHKYDPILQADYYRLQAFFANTAAADKTPLVSSEDLRRYNEKLALWKEKTRAIREEMDALEAPHREKLVKEYYDKYPTEIRAILNKPETERNPFERQMAWKAKQYLDPDSREFVGATAHVIDKIKGDNRKRWNELKVELDQFKELHPGELPLTSAMTDIGREAPKTFILRSGAYDAPRDEVEPGFLTILNPLPAKIVSPPGMASSGRRTALANILTDPENPLTARVMVNRLWQYHFGRGIVGTPSDFGFKGERPTHPQLLDWLAGEFVRNGWSMKKLHRLILTSSTYQLSSRYDVAAARIDPDNKLLWRFPRQRLEGEVIRDCALAVAGLLNPKLGGPSVLPELPPGLSVRGGWKVSTDEGERNRRSVYILVRRNTRYPMFETFDMPDTHESCARRNVTTTPVQALTMLNSELTLKWAEGFAARVLQAAGNDLDAQIDTAFRLALSRHPDKEEKKTAKQFFARQQNIVKERMDAGEPLALPPKLPEKADKAEAAVLVDFCHTLVNANEFVYEN